MLIIDKNNTGLRQNNQTKEYKEEHRQYELFARLGLMPPYDGDCNPEDVEWHPSNYNSFKDLEDDRERALRIYFQTGQIPDELANKLYIAYQEELQDSNKEIEDFDF